jgi:hypothetical protein
MKTILKLWAVVLVVGALALMGRHESPTRPAGATTTSTLPTKPPATSNIVINYSWHRGGFESVMLLNFTVRNQNGFAIKDFHYRLQPLRKVRH